MSHHEIAGKYLPVNSIEIYISDTSASNYSTAKDGAGSDYAPASGKSFRCLAVHVLNLDGTNDGSLRLGASTGTTQDNASAPTGNALVGVSLPSQKCQGNEYSVNLKFGADKKISLQATGAKMGAILHGVEE